MTAVQSREPSVSARRCPVCESARAAAVQSMRFALPDGHPLSARYDVVCCARCGFVYADTPSPQADYDRYYEELSKYSDSTTGTGAGVADWDRRRLEDTAATIADALRDTSATVLDIGCANGGLLTELARMGYRHLRGVDPSPACVAAANELAGVSAAIGTVFDLPPSVRGADCVVLSHVLEHVRDVSRALATLRGAVRDGGIAYVEVPDATRYAECLVAPFQDFNVEHINHFSGLSLSNALERSGFVVERTGQKTIAASATAPYPAVYAIARARSGNGASADPRPDAELYPAIAEYVARSRDLLAGIERHLDRELTGINEVVMWGTGQTTLTVMANTRVGGCRVVALTDSNPRYHGRRIADIPVMAPEEIHGFEHPIVVGSLIHHEAIVHRIRELGLTNAVVRLLPR
jgi:ubiquinone/menaquinone biosynthesis C-methylase UbiE